MKAKIDELRRDEVPRRTRALLSDDDLIWALTASYEGEEGASAAIRELEAGRYVLRCRAAGIPQADAEAAFDITVVPLPGTRPKGAAQ